MKEKRIVKDIDDEMMKEGKGLGRKKDKSIEEGKRGRKREKKKNERWVKRWNEEKEEKRMEKRNRNDERIVGGDDIECDMSCEWWGLEKYIGEKMKVEKRKWGSGESLIKNKKGKLGCEDINEVGRIVKKWEERIGKGLGKDLKGFWGRLRESIEIRKNGGGRKGWKIESYRIIEIEGIEGG